MHPCGGSPSRRSGIAGPGLVVAVILGLLVSASGQDVPRPSSPRKAAGGDPLVFQAEVIDPAGAAQSDVEVIVALEYWQRSGIHRQVLERIRTDQAGRIRLKVAREGPGERLASARIWAHRPGRGVAESAIALSNKTPRPMRLTLGTPAQRTFTVLGPDGHPIPGIRVTPHSLVPESGAAPPVFPRPWADRFAGITNADGEATIADLPTRPPLARVEFGGPGIAPHLFTLPADQANATIKLGRPGRLVGLVRTESGQPIAGASVAVWLGAPLLGRLGGPRRTSAEFAPVEMIRFDPGPVESGPQGAFQSPPTLLTGSTYRVVVRKDGFEPIASEWVAMDGERAVVSPVRLRALRAVVGEVCDRQGGPIASARVFLPGGGSSTTTDAQGHFELKDVPPRKAILLVEKPGFRLQGWPVDPSAAVTPRTFIPSRATEPPDRAMKPMADPIPPEEARTLANRLLEPYLRDLNDKDERIKLQALMALTDLAPDRAVDLFPTLSFGEGAARHGVRADMAAKLAEVDRPRAEALLASAPLASIPYE
jgi:Carboxypeptidase regulatory-like domain